MTLGIVVDGVLIHIGQKNKQTQGGVKAPLKKESDMKNLRWLVLGYFMAICINGCDLGLSSNDTIDNGNQANDYGDVGTVPWNPLYVKIVD